MVSMRNKKNYHQMLPLIWGSGNMVDSVPLAWADVPIVAHKIDGLPAASEAELLVAVVRLSVIYLRSKNSHQRRWQIPRPKAAWACMSKLGK